MVFLLNLEQNINLLYAPSNVKFRYKFNIFLLKYVKEFEHEICGQINHAQSCSCVRNSSKLLWQGCSITSDCLLYLFLLFSMHVFNFYILSFLSGNLFIFWMWFLYQINIACQNKYYWFSFFFFTYHSLLHKPIFG